MKLPSFTPTAFQPTAAPFVPTMAACGQGNAKKDNFNFPDGGWECSKCQNYNFKGRKNCHRCKKSKDDEDIEGKPEHMMMAPQAKAAMKASQKQKRTTQKGKKAEEEGAKTSGDWVCQGCSNHNYSFRNVCNKCQMSYDESANLLSSYQDGARFLNFQLNL